MALRFLYGGILILALFVGYSFWSMHAAIAAMDDAPQGQSVGPEDADIVVVEILDYRCHACRRISPVIEETIRRHPDVRFVFRHLPVYGKPAVIEAQLALAAGKQGKFIEMHHKLIARDRPVSDTDITALAKELDLNESQLREDMKSEDINLGLLRTVDAVQALKINVTPSFIIDGVVFAPIDYLPEVSDFDRILNELKNQ